MMLTRLSNYTTVCMCICPPHQCNIINLAIPKPDLETRHGISGASIILITDSAKYTVYIKRRTTPRVNCKNSKMACGGPIWNHYFQWDDISILSVSSDHCASAVELQAPAARKGSQAQQ